MMTITEMCLLLSVAMTSTMTVQVNVQILKGKQYRSKGIDYFFPIGLSLLVSEEESTRAAYKLLLVQMVVTGTIEALLLFALLASYYKW